MTPRLLKFSCLMVLISSTAAFAAEKDVIEIKNDETTQIPEAAKLQDDVKQSTEENPQDQGSQSYPWENQQPESAQPEEVQIKDQADDNADKAEQVVNQEIGAPAGVKKDVSQLLSSSEELKVGNVILDKKLLAQIYAQHENKTIFFNGEEPNQLYAKAIDTISKADFNGLSLRYFNVEAVKGRVENNGENNVAETDLLITQMITEMLLQIGNGRKIPDELKIQTFFKRPVRVENGQKAFEEFLSAENTDELIEKYSPKNPQYGLLKKALAQNIERVGNKRNQVKIDYTGDINPGDKNRVVADIRNRIDSKRSVDPGVSSKLYDKNLVNRVLQYKQKFKMKENPTIDKEFIDNLNSFDNEEISRIKANMERYRWLQDNLEPTRIEVNLPEYKLFAYRDGKEDFSMAAIVGKDAHRTPIMSTRMYQFILNPYWNVPKDYSLRNMVPLLKQDPNYVKNQNFELLQMTNDGWKQIDQSSINWNKVTKDNYNFLLRQRPGNINVLGPIKFAIANPYDIYIHSTSEPWLFSNETRGYSSGCIRVEDPKKLAAYVIEIGGAQITKDQFKDLYETYISKDGRPMPQKPEKNDKAIKLNNQIPTYTTYFSAKANEDGSVNFYNDSYGLDYNMAKIMGL